MGIEIVVAVGAILLLVGTFWILARQPHPDDPAQEMPAEGKGPTGQDYPPGSTPAGPGAESQVVDDSQPEDGSP